MKKNIIVICDENEQYLRRLDEALTARLSIPAEIYSFTDPGKLMEYTGREEVLILIASDDMLDRISGTYESILVLEGRDKEIVADDGQGFTGPVSEHVKRVSKYRSAEVIVGSILDLCSEVPMEKMGNLMTDTVSMVRRTVFYSPVNGCGQSSLAIALAQCLADQGKRVLLLNMEPCSGWSISDMRSGEAPSENIRRFPGPVVLSEEDDDRIKQEDKWEGLSELMYYAACNETKFPIYLRKLVRKHGGIDYIPPVRIPGQLRSIHTGEWQELFSLIDQSDMYDDMVIDLSDAVDGLEYILSSAERVYTMTGTGIAADHKLREYEKGLGLAGLQDVLYRTRKVAIPRELTEHGSCQEIKDYVKELLMEDISTEWRSNE